MFNYVLSLLFFFIFVFFLQYIGSKFSQEKRFSFRLIVGFLIFTSIQAVGGIFISILHGHWNLYVGYVTISIFILLLYKASIKDIKKITITVIIEKFKTHLKEYWLFYCISFIFVGFALLNLKEMWAGNRQDDGWYITQIAKLPKMGDVYNISAPTGFEYTPSFMRIFNTFEMEAAYLSKLFHIHPNVFVKFALALFNYFLFCCCVYEFTLCLKLKEKKNLVLLKSIICLLLLFALTGVMLQTYGLIKMVDDWQFNSAMGYGSSIVRILGFFFYAIFFMNEKTLFCKKNVVYYILIGITLMTSSTQALPMIYIITAAFLIDWIYLNKEGKIRLFLIIAGVLFLLLIPALGVEYQDASNQIFLFFKNNFEFIIPYISVLVIATIALFSNKKWKSKRNQGLLLLFIISLGTRNLFVPLSFVWLYSTSFNSVIINKWNRILCYLLALMMIPYMNTLFIDLSVYWFVVGRTLTSFTYIWIITMFIYLLIIILEHFKNIKQLHIYLYAVGISLSLLFLNTYSTQYNLVHAFAVLKDNPILVPNSTLKLEEKLQTLSDKQQETLNVLIPRRVTSDELAHYPYISLRIDTDSINSVSALLRYPDINPTNIFADFSEDDQQIFELVIQYGEGNDETKETYGDIIEEMEEILTSYPINCIVVTTPYSRDIFQNKFGYTYYDEVTNLDPNFTYYILYK